MKLVEMSRKSTWVGGISALAREIWKKEMLTGIRGVGRREKPCLLLV